jgi:hypothetical protein
MYFTHERFDVGFDDTVWLRESIDVAADRDGDGLVSLSSRQFGRIGFSDGDEHGFEIVDDEPRVDTVLDMYALFFQLVEDRFRVGVKSALDIVDGLSGTFQLVTFHVVDVVKVSVAGAALVFLGVGR